MKSSFTPFRLGLMSCLLLCCLSLSAQYVTIPDANFRGYLQQNYPTCFNASNQLDTTCSAITSLTYLSVPYKNIADLTGLQYFDGLYQVDCSHNVLTSLPKLPINVNNLNCSYNAITTLPTLTANLNTLNCEHNSITTLPSFPSSLQILTVRFNQISVIPTLPSGLIFLHCGNNQLTNLPTLPTNLVRLECENNQLTSIPSLPNTLYALVFYNNQVPSAGLQAVLPTNLNYFDASNNPLTVFPDFSTCPNITQISVTGSQIPSIPPLPVTLTDFRCANNLLISTLPMMPSGLRILEIEHCNIAILPSLPNELQALQVSYNPITNFPTVLPDSLRSLTCDSANITFLPTIPIRLYLLTCSHNYALSCLPLLPPKLEFLSVTATGINCLPNHPMGLSTVYPATLTNICNSSSPCALYPEVTGKAFIDINNNGQQDAGDAALGQRIILFQPNNWAAITDANGNYDLRIPANTAFTETTASVLYYTTNPSSYAVNLAMGQIDSLNNFALYPTPNVNDLRVTLTSSVARPGFDAHYWLTYENVGTTTLTGTVSFTYNNGILTYLTSSVVPSSQIGNTLTWNFTNLAPFASQSITLLFNVNATTPLGTILSATADIQPSSGDATPADNIATETRLVQGAFDPNEKLVNYATLTPNEVNLGKDLVYTIFFQNTGTDTAFNIKVIDTLSQNLDISTLKVLSASHPYNLLVSEQGTLHFHFVQIQLPDSNINEAASHGFVKYKIDAKAPLALGDKIHNTAHIYFDYNVPIVTNTATTTIANTSGIAGTWGENIRIYPNPAQSQFVVEFTEIQNPSTLSLLDVSGKVVLQQILTNKRSEIEIKALAKGIYFIQIQSEKGIMTRKLGISE